MTQKPYVLDRFKAGDHARWNDLWRGYMSRHDPAAVRDTVMKKSWDAVVSQDGRIHAWALRDDADFAQGFAHYVTYFSTDSGMYEAYLMDLYVDPDHRGQGGGVQLVERVIADCKDKGLSRLIWITVPGVEYNERFYSKFAKQRAWDRYVVMCAEPQEN